MRPIVIVQHEADSGPGGFEQYLSRRGLPHLTVRVFAGDAIPRSASSYSGVCSLGGSMSVNDELPWIIEELDLMRDADRHGVPIIGHCLGGQLLAKAFGAPVTRSAMKEIGWSEVEVDDVALARQWIGDDRTVELFQWHGDTFALPTGARRFLTSPLCANQAFVLECGSFAHLAMQFHVEMTPQLVHGWATDASGVQEVEQAFAHQNGIGVQLAAEMLRDLTQRTQRMHIIAERLYGRWILGLAE